MLFADEKSICRQAPRAGKLLFEYAFIPFRTVCGMKGILVLCLFYQTTFNFFYNYIASFYKYIAFCAKYSTVTADPTGKAER